MPVYSVDAVYRMQYAVQSVGGKEKSEESGEKGNGEREKREKECGGLTRSNQTIRLSDYQTTRLPDYQLYQGKARRGRSF